jgi:hypothetical protein
MTAHSWAGARKNPISPAQSKLAFTESKLDLVRIKPVFVKKEGNSRQE